MLTDYCVTLIFSRLNHQQALSVPTHTYTYDMSCASNFSKKNIVHP